MNKRQVAALLACSLISWWVGSALMPLLPVYVRQMGAVMASQLSSAGSGVFSFSQLPHASYGILAQHPDADFLVTTPNPQPVQISAQNELVDGIKIGVVRKQSLPDGDGDGVPDAQELLDGTDPTDRNSFKDSDGDGVPEFIENA